MAKQIEQITENISGEYLGIKVPEYSLFKVELNQKSVFKRVIKTGEERNRTDDFIIRINRPGISDSAHQEISKNLKDLFGMSFVSYDYASKTYHYYTNQYTGSSEFKKEKLNKILDYLSEFEKEYKISHQASLDAFNSEKQSFEPYTDHMFVVKYHAQKDVIALMLKGFAGKDTYAMVARASSRNGTLSTLGLEEDFFDDVNVVKKKEFKRVFLIAPAEYNNIKNFIEQERQKKQDFLATQEQVAIANKDKFIQYTEDNVFDFRLKYDEDKKVFDFYCKGYSDPTMDQFGRIPDRSLLAKWALNFILSETISLEEYNELNTNVEKFDAKYVHRSDYDMPYTFKINLGELPDSSKRDKSFLIPAENWEKLNQIYERFQAQQAFFGRPEKTLKTNAADIMHRNQGAANLRSNPAIYFDQKGKAYLIYAYRTVTARKADEAGNKDAYLSMKGVSLTFDEVNYFLDTHPMSEKIKHNSVFLNSEVWLRAEDKLDNFGQPTLLNEQEREDAFNTIYMHAKLLNTTQEAKKTKRMKI